MEGIWKNLAWVAALLILAVVVPVASSHPVITALRNTGELAHFDSDNLGDVEKINVAGEGFDAFDVTVSADGKRAYVAVSDSDDLKLEGNVMVVDFDSASTSYKETLSSVGVGVEPRALALAPDGNRLYVANYGDDSISVVDLTGDQPVTMKEIGLDEEQRPGSLAVSADGKRLFVANFGSVDKFSPDDGSVSVIDTVSNEVITVIEDVPSNPTALALSASGEKLYVASAIMTGLPIINEIGRLAVIDIVSSGLQGPYKLEHVEDISGFFPVGIAVSPSGAFIYISNSVPGYVNSISYDASKGAYGKGPLISTGGFARDVAVSPDGQKIFVANEEVSIGVYNPFASESLIGAVQLGKDSKPHGVSVPPNQLPSLESISIEKAVVKTGEEAIFTIKGAADADGKVVKYLWDFGDGGKGVVTTNSTVNHSYTQPGNYKVKVTAIDDDGSFDKRVFTGQGYIHYGDEGSGTKAVEVKVESETVIPCSKGEYSIVLERKGRVKIKALVGRKGLSFISKATHASAGSYKLKLANKDKKKLKRIGVKVSTTLAKGKLKIKAGSGKITVKIKKRVRRRLARGIGKRRLPNKLRLKLLLVASPIAKINTELTSLKLTFNLSAMKKLNNAGNSLLASSYTKVLEECQ